MIDYTSTANIEGVKRRATLPDNAQGLFPDDDICKILTAELHSDIVPLLMGVAEEFFLHNKDHDIVSGTNYYEIPARAAGQKLKDVVLLDSSGNESILSRIDPSEIKHSSVKGFHFEDDRVRLLPDGATYSQFDLRMKYFRRPNNIVETTDAGRITAINTGTRQVTIANLPVAWTTSTTFDFIKGTPGFKSRADDQAISAINSASKILTFSSALPDGLIVGDWVAESGFSPIAQIPYDVHPLLEQRAVIKILEGLGDREGMSAAGDVYKDMVDKFMVLVTPRSDGTPKKIISRNPLFGGSSRRPPWW